MEFYREIKTSFQDVEILKNSLTISSLPSYSDSIFTVNSDNIDAGEIFSIWGHFDIRREILKCGVRFSFLNCPHAFVFTITLNQSKQEIIIHSTIDKRDEDPDFIESLGQFMDQLEKSVTDLCN